MLADEPVGGGRVGHGQGCCTCLLNGVSVAVVDIGRGVHPDPGMAMILVVPAVEPCAERAGVLEGAEPLGEVGPVLQGLELGLGERVVIARMRPGVRLGDAEIGEQVTTATEALAYATRQIRDLEQLAGSALLLDAKKLDLPLAQAAAVLAECTRLHAQIRHEENA